MFCVTNCSNCNEAVSHFPKRLTIKKENPNHYPKREKVNKEYNEWILRNYNFSVPGLMGAKSMVDSYIIRNGVPPPRKMFQALTMIQTDTKQAVIKKNKMQMFWWGQIIYYLNDMNKSLETYRTNEFLPSHIECIKYYLSKINNNK